MLKRGGSYNLVHGISIFVNEHFDWNNDSFEKREIDIISYDFALTLDLNCGGGHKNVFYKTRSLGEV